VLEDQKKNAVQRKDMQRKPGPYKIVKILGKLPKIQKIQQLQHGKEEVAETPTMMNTRLDTRLRDMTGKIKKET
jgi:hypothetical protein